MPSTSSVKGLPQPVAPPLFGSCRLNISLVLMLGGSAAILMTSTLSFAIVCINQNKTYNDSIDSNSTNCTYDEELEQQSCIPLDKEVFWSKSIQGLLLGGTFYGVVTVQILVGYLSDKYGYCKLQMLAGNTFLSLANFLTPLIIIYLGEYYYFALRILMGISAAFVLSSNLNLVRYWASRSDQGLLVGLSMGGISFANALINPIAATMCYYGGWKSIFYLGGSFGLLWVCLGSFILYDTPNKHPRISAEEMQYLNSYGLTSKKNRKSKVPIPWSKIFTSVPVWSVMITNFFYFAATKGLTLTLPLFIREALDFSIAENGIYSALPSIGNFLIRFSTGPVFDYVRSKNKFNLTNLRKIFHAIGTIFPAAILIGVSQIGVDQKYWIIALITIGLSLSEVSIVAGFGICLMDVAPNFTGILQGVNNSIGFTPGFIMPLVISALTPNGTPEEWSNVYLIFGCLFSISFLVFIFTGNARRQKWAETKPNPLV